MTTGATAQEEQLLRDGLAALGGKGSGMVARFLRTDVRECTTSHAGGVADASLAVVRALSAGGRVVAQEASPDGGRRIFGVMGSGGMNLNPTVITICVTPEPEQGCTVLIRAAAKEGLINQRTTRKAVQRLRRALAT